MFPWEANNGGLRSSPGEANDRDFRRTKSNPKRHNSGTVIYRLVMYFDGKTYNP